MLVFGTRPEAIKMAPLVKEFEKYVDKFQTIVCVTGQHRKMLDQVLDLFDIVPDYDLNIMKENQDLYDVTVRVLVGMRDVLKCEQPDIVLVHGDTTTSISAALAAFYQQIPVGHVEAGLRTHNIYSPWPEEMNRLITVIDALYWVIRKIESNEELRFELDKSLRDSGYDAGRLIDGKKLVLITGHRRENFGEGFNHICQAIKVLVEKYPEVDFVYPMHLNPNVRKPIREIFGEDLVQLNNIFFIEPLEYFSFVYLMEKAHIVLTDSGGIQEEAPGLGKPVLVMRDTTERPEALEAGTVLLVGTNTERIIDNVSILLCNSEFYDKMSHAINPYGDGLACQRIVDILS